MNKLFCFFKKQKVFSVILAILLVIVLLISVIVIDLHRDLKSMSKKYYEQNLLLEKYRSAPDIYLKSEDGVIESLDGRSYKLKGIPEDYMIYSSSLLSDEKEVYVRFGEKHPFYVFDIKSLLLTYVENDDGESFSVEGTYDKEAEIIEKLYMLRQIEAREKTEETMYSTGIRIYFDFEYELSAFVLIDITESGNVYLRERFVDDYYPDTYFLLNEICTSEEIEFLKGNTLY